MKTFLSKFASYLNCWLVMIMVISPAVVRAESISISPGDTLSSDVLNDLLKPLSDGLEVGDLLGAWGATQAVCLGGTVSIQREGLCEGSIALSGSTKFGGSHYERADVWQIELLDRDDFPLRISSQNYNFLFNPVLSYLVPNDPITWHCELSGDRYLSCIGPENITYDVTRGCQHDECLIHVVMEIERASASGLRISLGPADTSLIGGSANLFGLFNIITLSKNEVLPIPKLTSARSADNGVTLEWSVSTEFSGPFQVRRKSELYGDFEALGLVNTSTYLDEVRESGKYWYRIFAEKDGEFSLGSNVLSVAIE